MAGLYELAQNRRRADSGGELGTFRRFLIDHDGRVKARELPIVAFADQLTAPPVNGEYYGYGQAMSKWSAKATIGSFSRFHPSIMVYKEPPKGP